MSLTLSFHPAAWPNVAPQKSVRPYLFDNVVYGAAVPNSEKIKQTTIIFVYLILGRRTYMPSSRAMVRERIPLQLTMAYEPPNQPFFQN